MAKPPDDDAERDALLEGLDTYRARRAQAARDSKLPLFRCLGIIGGVGWVIVVPTLLGLALGRWIDHRLGGGIIATGALLGLGLVVGCRLAWNRMHHP